MTCVDLEKIDFIRLELPDFSTVYRIFQIGHSMRKKGRKCSKREKNLERRKFLEHMAIEEKKNSNNNNKRRIKKNRKVNFLREGRMKFKQDMIFKNFKRISSQFNSTLLMFQPR